MESLATLTTKACLSGFSTKIWMINKKCILWTVGTWLTAIPVWALRIIQIPAPWLSLPKMSYPLVNAQEELHCYFLELFCLIAFSLSLEFCPLIFSHLCLLIIPSLCFPKLHFSKTAELSLIYPTHCSMVWNVPQPESQATLGPTAFVSLLWGITALYCLLSNVHKFFFSRRFWSVCYLQQEWKFSPCYSIMIRN